MCERGSARDVVGAVKMQASERVRRLCSTDSLPGDGNRSVALYRKPEGEEQGRRDKNSIRKSLAIT
jgi:hypothetical protein